MMKEMSQDERNERKSELISYASLKKLKESLKPNHHVSPKENRLLRVTLSGDVTLCTWSLSAQASQWSNKNFKGKSSFNQKMRSQKELKESS